MALIALAGCGGGDDGTGGTDTATEEASAPAEEPSEDATATGDAAVEVASTTLGDVVVGANGMTLYMFDPDAQGDPTCYDDCATAWPPLIADGEPAVGEGLDEALLGTVDRTDGTSQVTYNDWPLYYWAKDTAAGDVTGQAVGEKWWVVGPDGEPIKTAPEATS